MHNDIRRTDPVLTPRDIAERVRSTPGTVLRYARSGELVGIRLGDRAHWRFSEQAFDDFIARRAAAQAAATAEQATGDVA